MTLVSELTGPSLLIDSASSVTWVGLHMNGRPAIWTSSPLETGVSLFRGVSECLSQAGLTFPDLTGFVYCEGPGTQLGIRTAAMALRAWLEIDPKRKRPVYTYRSHDLAAAFLLQSGIKPPFHIITDARRSSWFVTSVRDTGSSDAIERVEQARVNALSEPAFIPEGFPNWSPIPARVSRCPYTPSALTENGGLALPLTQVELPGVFTVDEPEYKKWTPTVHGGADPES